MNALPIETKNTRIRRGIFPIVVNVDWIITKWSADEWGLEIYAFDGRRIVNQDFHSEKEAQDALADWMKHWSSRGDKS